jgi:phytanoyl-CoA hydroxylase
MDAQPGPQPPASPAGPTDRPTEDESLWLDEPSARRRIRRTRTPIKRHLDDLERVGLTVLPGAISAERCDQVIADLDHFLQAHGEVVAEVADEHGRFRVSNFHSASPTMMGICLEPPLLAILDAALGHPAVAYSSLAFVKGTEQYIHRDGPYFATTPVGFFFGVWTALEDIQPSAGPLLYYPGGHRLDVAREGSVASHSRAVLDACQRAKIKAQTISELRKGDVVIWHPELPHGGAPITDRGRTRKSMVVHYKAGAVPLHGPEEFFGRHTPGADRDEYALQGDRWVVERPFVTIDPPPPTAGALFD